MGPFLCLLSGFSHRSPSQTKPQSCNPSLWTAPACRHAPCFSLIWMADLPIPQLQHLIPTHGSPSPQSITCCNPCRTGIQPGRQAAFKTAQYGTRPRSTVQPEQATLCCVVSPDSVLLCCLTSPLRSKAHTNGKTPILQCK